MRRVLSTLGRGLLYGVVTALVALPVVVEQSIERARFDDRLGTFPVEVSLAHNGRSTVDTGLVGRLYWERTGFAGFGAELRSTGPPEAGGTLTSYVSQEFLQANAAFVDDPGGVAAVYGAELRSQVVDRVLTSLGVAAVAGAVLGTLLWRGPPRNRRRQVLRLAGTAVAMTTSLLLAVALFARWSGNEPVGRTYAMPGIEELSFSSPQTREVAQQVQPFIEKNSDRIAERSAEYRAAAEASFAEQMATYGAALTPRDGERVVLLEGDPQGSQVATRLRTALYPLLADAIGAESLVLRTIAGDVTSNGAVAEEGFVEREATAFPDVDLVAVKGDHDSDDTVAQLRDHDVEVPDLEIVEAGGLPVAGAADPAFKALFGGLVTNPSGLSEPELGERLREVVDDDWDREGPAPVVLVHQPRAASGYLGVGVGELGGTLGNETTPTDDGIDDVPPGIVSYGHLHDPAGPWVIWNTDGDEITWTVVTQTGTSGGVEENPTFNRFSTPFSVPLKDVSLHLAYVNPDTGLQTGYALIQVAADGTVSVEDRVDVGLPGGLPG